MLNDDSESWYNLQNLNDVLNLTRLCPGFLTCPNMLWKSPSPFFRTEPSLVLAFERMSGIEEFLDQLWDAGDDIAEMELMVKNRFNKGRKDNAQGGLQTMLGE